MNTQLIKNSTNLANDMRIQPNHHIAFIGMTRSGKTFLSYQLLRKLSQDNKNRQIIFIDPKHERTHFGDGSALDSPKLVKRYDPKIRFMVFQEYIWTDELELMVDKVLKLHNGKNKLYNCAIVVLDELGGIASSTSVPSGITRLWTQGSGKNVGCWACMQSTKRYPTVIKDQSTLFMVFRINNEQRLKDLRDWIPDTRVSTIKLPLHHFWFYKDGMDYAIHCLPLKVPKSKHPK